MLRIRIERIVDGELTSVSYNFLSNTGALVEFWFYSDLSELPDSGDVETYDYAYNGSMITLGVPQTTTPTYGITNHYPNPVVDKINLSLRLSPDEDATIRVYNALGKNVLSRSLLHSEATEVSQELDMTFLEPGVYIITLLTESFTQSVKVFKSI